MVKLKKNTRNALLFIGVLIVLVGLVATQTPFLQSIVGGGTLVKSISAVNFESNSQNIEESNFIIQLIVDGGSDSVIGNGTLTKQELTSLSGENIQNNFIISAQKTKNDLVVPILERTSPTFIYEILLDNLGAKRRNADFLESPEHVREEMARDLYNQCVSSKGQNFLGFGWFEDDLQSGLLTDFGATGLCYFRNTVLKVSDFDLTNKHIDWEVRFDLSGQTNTSIIVTDEQFAEILPIPGGWGTIRWTNNSLGNVLPPQIDAVKPARNTTNQWVTVPSDSQAPVNAIASFSNQFFVFSTNPNSGQTGQQQALVNGIVGTFKNSILGFYNLSGGEIRIPLDSSLNPEFQLTLKAGFVGIQRNVTIPSLSCSNNNIIANAGEEQGINLTVTNLGSVGGSISLTQSCSGTSFRLFPATNPATYSAGQSRSFTSFITSGNPRTLSGCYIEAYDTADPSIKSLKCNITGSFTDVSFCGDGVCNANESFQSCPGDCTQPTCGNNQIDAGETCVSCAIDVTCSPNGTCDRQAQACVFPECSDGIDNDGDTFIDLQDPDCVDANDNDESGEAERSCEFWQKKRMVNEITYLIDLGEYPIIGRIGFIETGTVQVTTCEADVGGILAVFLGTGFLIFVIFIVMSKRGKRKR